MHSSVVLETIIITDLNSAETLSYGVRSSLAVLKLSETLGQNVAGSVEFVRRKGLAGKYRDIAD